MNIKRNSFMGCCGIQILYNLGSTAVTLGTQAEYSVAETGAAISEAVLKGPIPPYHREGSPRPNGFKYAMQLIALNKKQHDKLHKMMLRKGFKLIDKGWNLNHRNTNYLYSLHLEEGKTEYKLK